jgi:hypothetical protein
MNCPLVNRVYVFLAQLNAFKPNFIISDQFMGILKDLPLTAYVSEQVSKRQPYRLS